MTRYIYIILFLSLFLSSNSQNLVPNGDFEQYNPCPTYLSQIDAASFWSQANQATSDYFNQCATPASKAGMPGNNYGYQLAHSGVGYAGLCPWWQNLNSYREYIEVPLDSLLSNGVCYYFEMYISSGDNCKFNTFEISAYFSNGNVLSGSSYYLPLNPQVNNLQTNIPDTLNWTLVSGTYTAQGGENYLVIGNFKNDQNTTVSLVNTNALFPGTYLYIDDVSLTRSNCNIQTNLSETDLAEANIYPNPFNDKITFTINHPDLFEIVICDITGHTVIQQNFTNSTVIDTENLDKGIYFYSLMSKDHLTKKGKLFKS